MKQAFLTDDGFVIEEVPEPAPGPGEVFVRVLANGVCAGEVGAFKDRAGRRGKRMALGHEATGEVMKSGAHVTNLRPGDRVTVCGGAFADAFVCAAENCVKLPPSIDPVWALGEPVACCVHAMDRTVIKPADRVAVVGCGFMGLICMQLAALKGAATITAIDPLPARLDLAKGFCAGKTIPSQDPGLTLGALRKRLGDFQGEYDVVIEAAGNQAALDLCGYLVSQHGIINLVGHHYSQNGMRTVYMNQWNVKAIDVINGHVRRENEKVAAMARGVAYLADGRLRLAPLVTPYPFDRIQSAFEDVAGSKPGLVKAVLVWA